MRRCWNDLVSSILTVLKRAVPHVKSTVDYLAQCKFISPYVSVRNSRSDHPTLSSRSNKVMCVSSFSAVGVHGKRPDSGDVVVFCIGGEDGSIEAPCIHYRPIVNLET